jgi:hypothetical protein
MHRPLGAGGLGRGVRRSWSGVTDELLGFSLVEASDVLANLNKA